MKNKIEEFYRKWKPNHRTEDCENNQQFKIQLQSLINSAVEEQKEKDAEIVKNLESNYPDVINQELFELITDEISRKIREQK